MGVRIGADHVIAALAGAQGGRVSREQLLGLGVSAKAIEYRLRQKRLHRDRPGVYAAGHGIVTPEGRRWSVLLAYGDDVRLSHFTAVEDWGLRDATSALIHITTMRTGVASAPGVVVHYTRRLPEHETDELRGMPITSPARTVLDVAPRLSDRRLEQLLDRGEHMRLLDLRDLRRVLQEHPGRAGTPRLRRVLAAFEPVVTRSELEELFLELLDRHGIPRPHTNAVVAGAEVDALWPTARLVVELDGYAHHRSRAAFESDRARDVGLTVAGYRVLRFSYRQVVDDPAAVAAAIEALLRI